MSVPTISALLDRIQTLNELLETANARRYYSEVRKSALYPLIVPTVGEASLSARDSDSVNVQQSVLLEMFVGAPLDGLPVATEVRRAEQAIDEVYALYEQRRRLQLPPTDQGLVILARLTGHTGIAYNDLFGLYQIDFTLSLNYTRYITQT